MRSKQKADHGHKKKTTSRAQEGEVILEHLEAAHQAAKNNYLLCCSKHITLKPCIARAPELVIQRTAATTVDAHSFSSRTFEASYSASTPCASLSPVTEP
jgi:hypothetical protein